jgi:hypothetical protein
MFKFSSHEISGDREKSGCSRAYNKTSLNLLPNESRDGLCSSKAAEKD